MSGVRRDRPHKGAPGHREWVVAAVRESRAQTVVDFMTWARPLRHARALPSERDFVAAGGWLSCRYEAAKSEGPGANAEPFTRPSDPDPSDRSRPPHPVAALGNEQSTTSAVPVDPLPERHHLRGVSTLVDAGGNIRAQWVKTAKDHETHAALVERLMRELPTRVPVREGAVARPRPAPSDADALMAVYPLGDPHVGMMAWAPETGADWDLRICEETMTRAMRDLVLRGPRCKRALIVNLGDFFHSDNAHGHTTNSAHSLDLDGRTPKVLAIGLRIFTTLIDAALEHHDEVTVDCRIGNHDAHTSLMLSIALGAFYRQEPRVSIPATVSHRAYYTHGACLIGTTHGDRAKPEQLPQIMAAERAEDWGRTRHRYFYCGHLHHIVRREFAGCIVETFRTLAAGDSWHVAQGYRAGRDMHRITLHAELGEIAREVVNVDALLKRAA